MRSDHDLLISKLDAFTRKYYKDQLLRGALYSVGLLILAYLVAAGLEYVGRFGSGVRTGLFYGYLLAAAAVLVRFIAIPLFKLFRLGKVISHAEAARIIGDHFSEVKDKLLNTLQLRDQSAVDPRHRELIEASIAQRSRELGPVPFAAAIDLRRNTKYLRYALPPLLLLLLLLVAAPSLITGPTQRLIRHGNEFVPEAPFRFKVLNAELIVPEQQDFELEVALEGDVVPQLAEVIVDGRAVPLVKEGPAKFRHRFRNVQEAIDFTLSAEGFTSPSYTLEVVPSPALVDVSLTVEPPAYLGLPSETVRNAGDATVPAGSRVTWSIATRSAERLDLIFEDTTFALAPSGSDRFVAVRRFLQGRTYRMVPRHGERVPVDPLNYRIEVVPDLHPTIEIDEQVDSAALKRRYFQGLVGDDHGFTRLQFHYRFIAGGDSVAPEQQEGVRDLSIDRKNTRQEFFHEWDVYDLTINPGDRIEYWFEVWDNDGVNGAKRTRSATGVFEAPTLDDLAKARSEQSEAIASDLKQGIKEAQDLQRELDKLRRDLLDKKDLDWQDQRKMQDVLDRQKKLQEKIERTSEDLRNSQQQQQEYRQIDERLQEKQQQVQELFENVLSEEMKELYRKVQEMLDKLDKEKLQEQMEDMKMSQEDIEKELDRTLELFKQMEVEQKAEDIADKLEKLGEEQEKLSEDTKENKESQENLEQRQDSLNKAFEEVRKEMDELEKKNEELEKPLDLPDTEQKEQEIQDQQQQSSEQLDKKQNQKASENQKKAAEEMKQMGFQMKSSMQSGQQEQQEEDMDALRQLLENIVQLSFDQEEVMDGLAEVTTKDPRFGELGRTQKELRDDAKVIEDSLFALSKRVPQLQSIVNREMNAVNGHMDEALSHIGEARGNERHKGMAADDQQRAMTALNNLALLLDEALQQMQQQSASQKPGSGSCNKPGGSGSGQGKKPSMAKMKAQQEGLQKQLDAMKKAMEEGKKKGEKPGQQNPGGNTPGMSQQLAQLAAQQAAIRKEMQRMAQDMNKDGSGAGNGLNKLAEQMEKQEKDIVNKNITPETIKRQQDIMVRLLEAEKADRERELDQKRTSNEGRDKPAEDPARFFEYQQRKAREAELLRTVPAGLKPYYRDRVNDYFGTFDRP